MNRITKIIGIALFVSYLFFMLGYTVFDNKEIFKENIMALRKSQDYQEAGRIDKIVLYKNTLESTFNNNIHSKIDYIDIYGLFQSLLQKRVVEDVDGTKRVIKMANGKLTFVYPYKDISKYAEKITNLSNYCKEKKIYMAYINIPWRIESEDDLPFYIEDHVNETNVAMLKKITEANVNIIDLEKLLSGSRDTWFYNTDHHWTTDTAFEAYQIIIKNIDEKIDLGLTDKYLYDFDKKVYKNIFLGTYGKRVGKYYGGMDDFTYILPKFETDFTVINSRDVGEIESTLKGSFKDTMTYPEFLDKDLDRDLSVYYTYSKGTKAEIKITNMDAYNNKKVLILKDSFADNTYPFIALNFKETRVVDVRRFHSIRLYTYIEKFKPDVILFLQNSQSLYDEKLIKWQER